MFRCKYSRRYHMIEAPFMTPLHFHYTQKHSICQQEITPLKFCHYAQNPPANKMQFYPYLEVLRGLRGTFSKVPLTFSSYINNSSVPQMIKSALITL